MNLSTIMEPILPAGLDVDAQNVDDIYELSPVQEGILLHVLREPDAGFFFQQMVLPLRDLDVDVFLDAWQQVVTRHSILRTSFHWQHLERPLQVVSRDVTLPVERLDWRDVPRSEQERRLRDYLLTDRQRGFTLDQAPLMRLAVILRDAVNVTLVKSHHHLLLDGWSGSLLLTEVQRFYQVLRSGLTLERPAARPFRDYIQWLRQQDLTQAETFWRQRLAGFTAPTPLPAAHAQSRITGRVNRFCRQDRRLSDDLVTALQALAQRLHITLNTLVQGAWALLLSRWSGETDVLFGATFSGRSAAIAGIESMVGLFINALPVRIAIKPDQTLEAWLVDLQAFQSEVQHYEFSPPEQVHAWSQIPNGVALFETLVTFIGESIGWRQVRAEGRETTDRRHQSLDPTNYPFSLLVLHSQEGMTLDATAMTSHYHDGILIRLLDQMSLLLHAFVANPQQPLDEMSLMTPGEYHQIVHAWNQTQKDYPQDRCLHQLFEATVERCPTALAVLCDGDETLDFAMLNQKANQLAWELLAQGIQPETRIGLSVERSSDMLIGLLAILKAGAAYVPLDPAYPAERLDFMVADAAIDVLLTQQRFAASWVGRMATILILDADASSWSQRSDTNPDVSVSPEHLALVIYTSGSTGIPKGVAIPHRVCVNRMFIEADPVQPNEVFCAKTSLNFIDSVWELFLPWTWGCPTRLIAADAQQDVERLIDALAEAGVTRLVLVPSLLRSLLETDGRLAERLPTLKHWISSGEPLTSDLSRLFGERLPGRILTNLYGTSEIWDATRCDSRQLPIAQGLPIGRPMGNCRVYVLDARLRPVPVGMPGELCVAGAGLAHGYLNRPELTADRFVHDPFSNSADERLYRTGDLVCWRVDGHLEFLGRRDQQLKIRGFRIEPGEIESVLQRHPRVECAAVTATGRQQLIAYVVPTVDGMPAVEALRDWVRRFLPAHMVPATVLPLAQIPFTPSGKIDRRSLPQPDDLATSTRGLTQHPPETALEQALAAIWSDVLGTSEIGTQDSFFDLGGHSLLAMRMIVRLRSDLDLNIPIAVFFENSTIAALAAWIEQHRDQVNSEHEPALQAQVSEDADETLRCAPQSFSQQRLWFLCQLNPGTSLYNLTTSIPLRGVLDRTALEQALAELVRRHESLRTTFDVRDGEPVQLIAPPAPLALETINLCNLPPPAQRIELRRLRQTALAQPFDLARGPLVRLTLVLVEEHRQILLVSLHHLITDGWSMQILQREVRILYAAFRSRRTSPLPEPTLQYADFARWQQDWMQGDMLQQQLDYWTQQLHDLPHLELPTDRPPPVLPSFNRASHSFTVGTERLSKLRALARQEDATLFMLLLAAFQFVLGCHAGQVDVVVGTPIAGRTRTELEGLIGFFVNTLAIRTDLSGHPGFRELLKRVRATCLTAYTYQHLPFEKLVDVLAPQRDLGSQPLFQVLFVHQVAASGAAEADAVESGRTSLAGTAYFDLTLSLMETRSTLNGELYFNTDLFDPERMDRFVRHVETLLSVIATEPDRALSVADIMPSSERDQLLHDWNPQSSDNPDHCIHWLFEERVRQTPDQIAIHADGCDLTYRTLDERANALAWHLQELGLAPEQRVGLYMARSPDAIIGLLAILKAGGVYLPLDPGLPEDRLDWLLQDAQPSVVLTRQPRPAHVADQSITWCVIGEDSDTVPAVSEHPPTVAVTPRHLAYIIYTSGSTGTPKGVMIEHRSLCHVIQAQIPLFGLTSDSRVLATIALSFDASLGEIFRTLIAGSTLYLAQPQASLPGPELIALLRQQRITTTTLVPAALAALPQDDLPDLHTLSVGGEALSLELAQRWGRGRLLLNGYGPTETTIGATLAWDWPLDQPPPLGRPLPCTRAYVLNAEMALLPIGVPGELYLGGSALARGYFNRPDLTAERFMPDPFSHQPGSRLYRTGDRVYWRADGQLAFIGRIDDQVKIRGYRVEPGEITALLKRHPQVVDAVVLAVTDASGDRRLVAYVVPAAQTGDQNEQHAVDGNYVRLLRHDLKTQLPSYLIPHQFIILSALPLTAHGKLDRQRLASLDITNRMDSDAVYVAPRTDAEQCLAAIWVEMLRLERVGIHDNFFELGGDSLLGIRLLARANEAGLQLSTQDLYRCQTIAEQAAAATQVQTIAAEQETVTGVLPLTPIQHWFFAADFPDPYHFNWAFFVPLPADLAPLHLSHALAMLWEQHDVLRSRFRKSASGHWKCALAGLDDPIQPVIEDLSRLTQPEQIGQIRLIANAWQTSLNLEQGPLLRAILFRIGQQQDLLLIIVHHLVIDTISRAVFVEDLIGMFQQLRLGQTVSLPEKSHSFQRWATLLSERSNSADILDEWAYWLNLLEQPVTPFPKDHPDGRNDRGHEDNLNCVLAVEETRRLTVLARSLRVTVDEILLIALGLAIRNWAGGESVLFNIERHGRDEMGSGLNFSRTMGWFANISPLRLNIDPLSSAESLRHGLAQIRALPNRGIGYGLLRYLSQHVAAARLQSFPEPELFFCFHGEIREPSRRSTLNNMIDQIELGSLQGTTGMRRHAIEINAVIRDGQLRMRWAFSKDIYTVQTIEKIWEGVMHHLKNLLDVKPEGAK